MKRAFLIAVLSVVLLQSLAFFPGCGEGSSEGEEEKKVIDYVLESILIPRERDSNFIVEWRRKSSGIEDVSPEQLAQRYWKWEGGALSEITAEEYGELASAREAGNPNKWSYSQHAITLLEMDMDSKEALVEIGSLYNPMTGSGIRYLLREEGGEWTKVSEATVWVS